MNAAGPITREQRDRRAYELARAYLLGLSKLGVTEGLLDHYLTPRPSRLAPKTMREVYKRLLESAQNRNMMASVIGGSLGQFERLAEVLCDFEPKAVLRRFAEWKDVLDTVERALQPRGKIRRAPGALWPLFARAALSGARFLVQFPSSAELMRWIQDFDADDRKRAARFLRNGTDHFRCPRA